MNAFVLFIILNSPTGNLSTLAEDAPDRASCEIAKQNTKAYMAEKGKGYSIRSIECFARPTNMGKIDVTPKSGKLKFDPESKVADKDFVDGVSN